jgi:hypothetical protein
VILLVWQGSLPLFCQKGPYLVRLLTFFLAAGHFDRMLQCVQCTNATYEQTDFSNDHDNALFTSGASLMGDVFHTAGWSYD